VVGAIGSWINLGTFGTNRLTQIQAKLDGPLFDLPGGAVRFAGGGEYDRVGLLTGTQNGIVGNLVDLTRLDLNRTVKSAFAEFLLPIFGSANAIPGFRRLQIDGAIRYDSYSDVGNTWNPKVGVNWSPTGWIMFRGTHGTSFRAPNFTSLYSSLPSLSPQNFPDPKSPTGFTQGYSWQDGNLNLKPETATTWTFGADIKTDALPGLSMNSTYFHIRYGNQITMLQGNLNALQQEALWPQLIIRNPSPAFLASLTSGLPITGVPPAVVGVVVDARPYNLGTVQTSGIDLSIRYNLEMGRSRFLVGLNGTYNFNYDVSLSPGAPATDRINRINYSLRYNLRGDVGWSFGPVDVTAFVNHIPFYTNDVVTPVQRIHSWTTVDLNLSYKLSDRILPLLSDAAFSVNITNMFDRDPPFASIAPSQTAGGGFDVQAANPLGRVVTVGLRARF
jgi:iron complex outermembrane receptor protein